MPNIEEILQDLYKLEPELKMYEDKIRGIIIKMVESKPDTKFDDAFRLQLREELLNHIKYSYPSQQFELSHGFGGMSTNIQYLLSGFALAGLIAFAGFYYLQNISKSPVNMGSIYSSSPKLAFDVTINSTGNSAFGSLSGFGASGRDLGGGGIAKGSSSMSTNSLTAPNDTAGGVTEKMVVPDSRIYNPVTYKYIYSGDFDISNINLPVLKRNRGVGGAEVFQQVLGNLQLDSFDIKKLSSLKIDNINIFEDKDYGYNLYLNFTEGSLGIWRNYAKWPQISYNTPEEFEKNRLKAENIPSDETVLDKVNAFTKEYGIDTSKYGTPFVDNSWKKSYEETQDKTSFYFPESLTVVYPLMIEGKPVYEEYGQVAGIRISYDIRAARISDVSGIESMNLSSSNYDLIKDFNSLKPFVEQGGRFGGGDVLYGVREGGDTTTGNVQEIGLGSPSIAYVMVYDYVNNTQEKYYVPALVFPVQTAQKDIYKQTVVIPLVKEFYGK